MLTKDISLFNANQKYQPIQDPHPEQQLEPRHLMPRLQTCYPPPFYINTEPPPLVPVWMKVGSWGVERSTEAMAGVPCRGSPLDPPMDEDCPV